MSTRSVVGAARGSVPVLHRGFGLRAARIAVALAAAACSATSLAQWVPPSNSTVAPVPSERPPTVKARVNHGVSTAGGRVLASYDSFDLAEFPADGVPAVDGVEVLPTENLILLNAGPIDTSRRAGGAALQIRGSFVGKALHLVQFIGPVQPAWHDRLVQTGVQIVCYVPSNAYLVYGDAAQIANLQAQIALMPEVQWDGAYDATMKLNLPAQAKAADVLTAAAKDTLFTVQLVEDPDANKDTLALLDVLKGGPLMKNDTFLGYRNVIVPMAAADLASLAAMPDVVSVQLYATPRKMDERQDQIIAGNLTGTAPSAPGYLAWLGTQGFTQTQFTTSNFAVDVSDSGIDNATTSPNHFGLYVSGTRPGTSRVIYNRLVGTPNAGSTLQGCDGHGNLNSHIVAGYSNSTGSPFADASGYRYGLGVCPFVKVGSSVIFDPGTFTSPNYPSLQSQAYRDSARISTNSWGANTAGAYNSDCQTYDSLVRDAQPTGSTVPVAGNQSMVIVFSAGNAGSAAGTVGSPGSAKNVIAVGAAENVQAFGGSDGCGTADTGANSANDIISFSSRGPCTDGRKKPDIVAPGTHVSGGVAQAPSPAATGTANACYNGTGVCGGVLGADFFPAGGQQFYTASSGTSHSCPAVAGGAALVRQIFINRGLTAPSPAMTKALLMNSARYLNGVGANDTLWSNSQGMGEMNLGEAFVRGGTLATVFRDQVAADLFTATGQVRTFTGTIADTTKPFRVTLSWTDAPGSTAGSAFNNNLDLTVTVGATTYKGNVFTGQNSTTGGAADAANNTESVFLPVGTSGSYTVTVTATNINSDGVPNSGGALDQDFALVIANGNNGSCTAVGVATQPSAATACTGTSANFTVVASGTAPFTYQWRKGGSNISGATASTFTIASVVAGDAANYDCFITNGCGNVTSNAVALTVNTLPNIGIQPNPATACVGSPASFSVVANGTPLPTYQWRKAGSNIAGATAATYNIASTVAGDAANYDCVLTNSCGSITTNSVALTVNTAPSIGTQPSPAAACAGSPASFTVAAGGTPAPTFQWRKAGSNIPGATSATLSFASVAVGDAANYDCVLTNSCGSATTNSVALTVNTAPGITAQPTPLTVCVNDFVSFSVTVTGTPAPTYQWRRNGGILPGTNSPTLNINTVATGQAGTYDCVITNTCGSVTSNGALLTVNTSAVINTQPSPATACVGTPTSFTVVASGSPAPNYQWRKNGADIPGATGPTLSFPLVVAGDAANYHCLVSNSCGGSVTNTVALTVNSSPLIGTQPGPATACAGSPASFTVAATGTPSPTFQWRKAGSTIPGATSATLSFAAVAAGDAANYDCIISNSCGSALTNAVALTVNTSPSVGTQPSPASACLGGSASFTVSVGTGSPAPTFQWRKAGSNIPGATSATLSFASVGAGDAANYDCVLTNTCGTATSNTVALTVNTPPLIDTQPTPTSACVGSPAGFSIAASGSPLPTYQWRKGGVSIPGATGASLSFAGVAAGDAGDYDCVVTNVCTGVTSVSVTLSIEDVPSIAANPDPVSACANTPAVFTVVAVGSGTLTYQWQWRDAAVVGSGWNAVADGSNLDPVSSLPVFDAAGATTTSVTLSNFSAVPTPFSGQAELRAVVSDTCGTATGGATPLTVRGCPYGPCPADYDGSGGTPDPGDVDAFFSEWLAGAECADVDCSGGAPDASDVDYFFTLWLAGGC